MSRKNKDAMKFFFVSCIFLFLINVNFVHLFNLNGNANNFLGVDQTNLKLQDLSNNNIFSDIGSPWNITHYANRTDTDLAVSFQEGSSDLASIPLGSGWKGYELSATINNLVDERNFNNGTFNYGPDDGSAAAGENDTLWISNPFQNWTFGLNDTGLGSNDMSGNYLNNIGGESCLELRMDSYLTVVSSTNFRTYDPDDSCWWGSTIQIPRGKLVDSRLNFDLYPNDLANFNSWAFAIYLNDVKVYSIGTYTLANFGSDSWHSFSIPQSIWINNTDIFADTLLINQFTNLKLVLECVGGGNYSGFSDILYQRLYVDNVELVTISEALPSSLELSLNQTTVQDIDWGKGSIDLQGEWYNNNVIANFSTSDTGDLGAYAVSLDTNLNLFASKETPDTNYETNVGSLGTLFSVNNNSNVNWECYGFVAVPTGYKETLMKIQFSIDVSLNSIYEPANPSLNIISQCDTSIPGILSVPINTITSTPDGFWKFEATSPNYCEDLQIYNNATGVWIKESEFLSGEYINITCKITNTPIISSYIQNTRATLQLRFPNGSLWMEKTMLVMVDSNGYGYFEPFQIPTTPPNYQAGYYEAIVTWNNSYSTYGLNETGIIVKEFRVTHLSNLVPEISHFSNIRDGSLLNLRVSFNDLENFDAIENALIYTYNFTHPGIIQVFSEISPGFYLLEFNVTGAPNAGDNILPIFANSSNYVNSQANITIDIIKNTILTIDEDYIPDVAFEQNFTIQFNYTEEFSGIGIDTVNLSTDWVGEYNFIRISQGRYSLICNASGPGVQPERLYSIIVTAEAYKYQPQSLPVRVFISEKASNLALFVNGTQKLQDEYIVVEFWQKINITINYQDAIGNHLNGASVKLAGGGLLKDLTENPSLQHYSLLLNASELGLGLDYLSIFANKSNYNSQSIRIIAGVTRRQTQMQIYLNTDNKTQDPSILLPIGEMLNITIKYTDLNSAHIEDATVQIIGAVADNLTEDKGLNLYYKMINTSQLDIGVHFITITAYRENYMFQSNELRIEIRRIATNLTTTNGLTRINARPGDSVTLHVELIDLDFGGRLKGAFVSYSWEFGTGTLTDTNNDGIYEVTLDILQAGTHKVTLSGGVSGDYEFQYLEITIVAERSIEEVWLILILALIAIGAAIAIGSYIIAYQTVLKYPKPVRKVRKYRKKLDKHKAPSVSITDRKDSFNTAYKNEIDQSTKILKSKTPTQPVKPDKILKKLPQETPEVKDNTSLDKKSE